MRYGRAERLIQLALEMQAARSGLTIADIEEKFGVSRRTAIRMRDAVIRAYPQADEVPSHDRQKRWHIPNGSAQRLIGVTADDLATVELAAKMLDRSNLGRHAETVRALGAKVRAMLSEEALRQIEPDFAVLAESELVAHRPGPKQTVYSQLFETLRDAIKSCRKVTFEYVSLPNTKSVRHRVCPLGVLYGHRHYLVATMANGQGPALYNLPSITNLRLTDEGFDRDPDFNLGEIAGQTFGGFGVAPVDVVWRFSSQAANHARGYLFHPAQKIEEVPDGGVILRFRAGGLVEMAWHLLCWGDHVEVIEPAALREMMPQNGLTWPALP